MTGKPIREYQTEKLPAQKARPLPRRFNRRPFWLPASNFYVLTAAATIAVFFVVWGILMDGGEEMPWVWAGMAASLILGGAVFLREIVLRKARTRYLLSEMRLDANLKTLPQIQQPTNSNSENKLSIERNAAIIKEIQQKSEAARAFGTLSEAHLEVFDICNRYLALNEKQLETVGAGSPRLAALRRGKDIVQALHRYHLLSWAQNESRNLMHESKIRVTISDKLEVAQKALTIVDSALAYYPQENQLLESERALREFAATIKISHWIEQAERSAFKGNNKRAINHYRDALFFMARDADLQTEERRMTAEKINAEIDRLREISTKTAGEIKKIND